MPPGSIVIGNFTHGLRLTELVYAYWFRLVLELWSQSGFFIRQMPFHAPPDTRVMSIDRHLAPKFTSTTLKLAIVDRDA